MTRRDVQQRIDAEIASLADPEIAAGVRSWLIEPVYHTRLWEYGDNEPLPCWWIAMFPGERGVVFSEGGPGPGFPWGLRHLTDAHFGMDGDWFSRIEEPFIVSGHWTGKVPPDFELQ